MTRAKTQRARAIADVTSGTILATVEIAAPPERVFRALTTDEVTTWWGADDMYRTTKYTAELRVGGAWRSDGIGADGSAFHVGGEFVEIDPPRRLVHTWAPAWEAGNVTTVAFDLEPIPDGTRVTLRHTGFGDRADSCRAHGVGWEHVLGWLTAHLAAPAPAKYYFCRLIPPRPTFAQDLSPAEREMMGAHAAYWRARMAEGDVAVFGPVGDPAGAWGLGVVRAADEAALRAFTDGDPAVAGGLRYETMPMLATVLPE